MMLIGLVSIIAFVMSFDWLSSSSSTQNNGSFVDFVIKSNSFTLFDSSGGAVLSLEIINTGTLTHNEYEISCTDEDFVTNTVTITQDVDPDEEFQLNKVISGNYDVGEIYDCFFIISYQRNAILEDFESGMRLTAT